MSRARKSLFIGVLIAVPAAAWVACLASGREVFTKAGKAAEITTRDIFGDAQVEIQFQRGPILGYFIGLDLAVAVTVVALMVGGLAWWVHCRHARRQRAAQVNRGPNT